jgi:SAM-dependent methyltransferase
MEVAARWDDEYRRGRYADEPPVAFVDDILEAVRAYDPPQPGLYIGCGNGRNFVPLVAGGLDLVGLDISEAALEQLRARLPRARLVHGDLTAVDGPFGVVVAIQVLQHGDLAAAHANLRAAAALVAPGGLLCIRVNAVGTQLEHRHAVVEDSEGLTVRYEEGPKRGLLVHFFAETELERLTAHLAPVLPLRLDRTERGDGTHWDQWEGIWECA